jgi:hypothetical protein
MAVMNLESLVLRGIGVANVAVTGLKHIGSNPGQEPAPAVQSMARSTSPRFPQADAQLVMRIRSRDLADRDTGAERAGRSASCVRVSFSPCRANAAPRTPPTGRFSGAGMARLADWRDGLTAKTSTAAGRSGRRHYLGRRTAMAGYAETGKAQAGPLTEASTALLRGKGA